MRLVFDLETDNLELHKITQIHCIAAVNLDGPEEYSFDPNNIGAGIDLLSRSEYLVAHNGCWFDLPVIKKFYPSFRPKGTVMDTLILSRLSQPDRKRPYGMTGRAGPHSVEAWGYRLGHHKVEHEDWATYSPQMMHRCLEDAKIQKQIYFELFKEMNE